MKKIVIYLTKNWKEKSEFIRHNTCKPVDLQSAIFSPLTLMVVNQMMNENMNERQDQIWWIENICDSETDDVKGIVRQFFSIVQISYLGK